MPGVTRKVFLHIGAPKSGTTYLQDRLARNRELIAEQGVDYVETRTGDHFQAALDLIERPWAGELDRSRGQWQALVDAARKSKDDVLLVSHEILAAATPEQVQRVGADFAGDEVHVVLTARDLGRQIPAEWQEMVKHRSARTFRRFLHAVMQAPRTDPEMWFWRVQSLPDVLTRWGNGLPPERVHVVTVPQAGGPRDLLWQRFGSVVGLDQKVSYDESDAANASLGIAEVAVLRRLNRRLRQGGVSRETYVRLVREKIVREIFSEREGMLTARLPVEARPFVEEVTDEWLQWIDGSGVDVVGDVEELRSVWSPEEVPHPDQPSSDDVAEAAIAALAALVMEHDQTPVTAELARPLGRLGRRLWGR